METSHVFVKLTDSFTKSLVSVHTVFLLHIYPVIFLEESGNAARLCDHIEHVLLHVGHNGSKCAGRLSLIGLSILAKIEDISGNGSEVAFVFVAEQEVTHVVPALLVQFHVSVPFVFEHAVLHCVDLLDVVNDPITETIVSRLGCLVLGLFAVEA